jgi:hypothetical protein
LLVCLIASPLFTIGGHESVIAISGLGWLLIAALAVAAGVSFFIWLVVASRSSAVDAELVAIRRSHPGKWLFRISVMVCALFVVVTILSWLWVLVLVRHLPATHEEVAGRVTKVIRTGTQNVFCRFSVDVQLRSGSEVRICGELGLVARKMLRGVENLNENDEVTVALRRTALGTSVTFAASRNQE